MTEISRDKTPAAWLRAMNDIEHENVTDPHAAHYVQMARDAHAEALLIPSMTVDAAGTLLEQLNANSPDHEYTARIERIAGRTVVYLVRERRELMPPAYLRHG